MVYENSRQAPWPEFVRKICASKGFLRNYVKKQLHRGADRPLSLDSMAAANALGVALQFFLVILHRPRNEIAYGQFDFRLRPYIWSKCLFGLCENDELIQ